MQCLLFFFLQLAMLEMREDLHQTSKTTKRVCNACLIFYRKCIYEMVIAKVIASNLEQSAVVQLLKSIRSELVKGRAACHKTATNNGSLTQSKICSVCS